MLCIRQQAQRKGCHHGIAVVQVSLGVGFDKRERFVRVCFRGRLHAITQCRCTSRSSCGVHKTVCD